MLLLKIGAFEQYDEEKNEFIEPNPFDLKLEHSLLSISKWESIWKVPFLHTKDEKTGVDKKTREQTISYVKCMTLNLNVPNEIYDLITDSDLIKINEYINSDQTATWFSDDNSKKQKIIVTSEMIYYWLVAYQIPWEAQKWHLSRLYTLIRIYNIENNTKNNKMSKTDIMKRNRELNAARRAANNSKG